MKRRCGFPIFFSLALAGSVMIETSCRGDTMSDEILGNDLSRLRQTKLFFAHQSVGANIMQGLDELALRLGRNGPHLIGENIGTNGDPEGKIRDFERIMRSGMTGRTDVAFMKLCYADIDERTDTDALFALHRRTMSGLSRDYPDVVFIHFTAPLTAAGIKDRIKNILGRPTTSREGNMKREEYNALLRKEFGSTGRLFDLALVEATAERGGIEQERYRTKTFYLLRAEYTDDNGHLNKRGRAHAAGRLVSFLAGIIGQ